MFYEVAELGLYLKKCSSVLWTLGYHLLYFYLQLITIVDYNS